MESKLSMSGGVVAEHRKGTTGPGLKWQLMNYSRPNFLKGYLANKAAKGLSRLTGIPTLTAELRATLIKADGTKVDYGLLGSRVVTTAFVEFMVDQLQAETTEWGDFKFHDSGVGVTAENITDTDIETTDGEARVAGTQVEGASANIYRSVGTITYTTTKAITEHGLLSIVTGGTLMDRTVFTVINVVNTDQITFTYELTVTAGS